MSNRQLNAENFGCNGKTRVILAIGTHWDREWYLPFQQFRYRLIPVIDDVLNELERDARISVFHMDGQMSLIEDYLEIRPENRSRIAKLSAAGRLILGPWYTMPDVLLVNGESLFRNLELGRRMAEEFANSCTEGYVCDIFGFGSQIPQILTLAGLRSAFLFRGTNDAEFSRDFWWEAPDGSKLFCHRFSDEGGYCEFFNQVRRHDRAEGRPLDIAAASERAGAFIRATICQTGSDTILLSDAADHADLEPQIATLVERINEENHDFVVEIGSWSDFVSAATAEGSLPIHRGELRSPGTRPGNPNWLISNTLSSYAPLKLWNRQIERLLLRYAEPMAALSLSPKNHAHPLTTAAWKILLQNHAHDSICGCSVEAVHREMESRFRQAGQIAETIVSETMESMSRSAASATEKETPQIVIFNPLPWPVETVFECTADLPQPEYIINPNDVADRKIIKGFPHHSEGFFGEAAPQFMLKDAEGLECAWQRCELEPSVVRKSLQRGTYPKLLNVERVRMLVKCKLPPLGWQVLSLVATEEIQRPAPTLLADPETMENALLRVQVLPDGQIQLTCKRTGRIFSGLFEFEDNGEVGDGWFHSAPLNDRVIRGQQLFAKVVEQNGPLAVSIALHYRMEVPVSYDAISKRRSEATLQQKIVVTLTLRDGARLLDCRINVDNRARDHRLRVFFRNVEGTRNLATSSAYDLVERPLRPAEAYRNLREYPVVVPTSGITLARNETGAGLAIFSPGIYEAEGVTGRSGSHVALTLLRSFQKTILTDGEDGGQIPGDHEFTLGLMPVDSNTSTMEIFTAAEEFEFRPQAASFLSGGCAVQEKGFLHIKSGSFVLTSLRRNPDGLMELAGFNPEETDTQVELEFGADYQVTGFQAPSHLNCCFESPLLGFHLRGKQIARFTFNYPRQTPASSK